MRFFRLMHPGILLFTLFAATGVIPAQTYKFAKLEGIPVVTTGWNMQGNASVGNTGANPANGEIVLTPAQRSQRGAIFFNTAINLDICNKWITEFEFRIADGNGADGLAFCYLDVPPVGFAGGGGLGIPATANGLKICVDTYWNGFDPANSCPSGVPKLEMRWGQGYNECADTQPTYRNTNGDLSFIRDGNFHKARITYNKGNMTFAVDGKVYLTGFQTFNFTGYFGFTAGTGNGFDAHSIRNAVIYTDTPDSDAGSGATICSGATAQIGLPAPNPIYSYTWSPSTGLDNPKIVNPKVTLSHAGALPSKRKYYLFTEFAAIPGCSSVDSIEVIVNPIPNVTLSAKRDCFNDTMQITPVTGWPDSIHKTLQWQWNFGDPGSSANNSTAAIGLHQFTAPGNYNVSVNLNTREGCSANFAQPLLVRALPAVGFDVVNSGAVCINQPVKFVQLVNAGNKGFTSIVPDLAAGQPVIKFSKMALPGDTLVINYRTAGIAEGKPYYLAKWMNTDEFGCTSSAVDTVFFRSQPKIIFGPQANACLNVPPFVLQGASETSGIPGNGFFTGRGITNPNGTFNPALAGVGTQAIRYIYQAQNGCTDTAIQNMTVHPVPVVDAGPSKAILPGGSALLDGSSSETPKNVLWTPSTGLSNPTILKPVANPSSDQKYYLQVTTQQGCTAADSVLVRALPGLTIPNAFSPHVPDGTNDTWIIKDIDLFPGTTLEVYDRYGRLVYRSTGYPTPWDGKINGVIVPSGVYYYIIDPKNGAKQYAGSLTIL